MKQSEAIRDCAAAMADADRVKTGSLSNTQPRDCTKLFRVLSEAHRWDILRELSRGPLAVGDLESRLRLPQYTVSRHLAVLRRHGFVTSDRVGHWKVYRLTEGISKTRGTLDLGCCSLRLD